MMTYIYLSQTPSHNHTIGVYSNDTMMYYSQYIYMTNTVGTYLDLFVEILISVFYCLF